MSDRRGVNELQVELETKRVCVLVNVMLFYLCDFHDFDSCQLARLDMPTLVGYMKKEVRPQHSQQHSQNVTHKLQHNS